MRRHNNYACFQLKVIMKNNFPAKSVEQSFQIQLTDFPKEIYLSKVDGAGFCAAVKVLTY